MPFSHKNQSKLSKGLHECNHNDCLSSDNNYIKKSPEVYVIRGLCDKIYVTNHLSICCINYRRLNAITRYGSKSFESTRLFFRINPNTSSASIHYSSALQAFGLWKGLYSLDTSTGNFKSIVLIYVFSKHIPSILISLLNAIYTPETSFSRHQAPISLLRLRETSTFENLAYHLELNDFINLV